jgi:hypothetical protein
MTKLYFLDAVNGEDWCYTAKMLGWAAETVVSGTLLEDSTENIVFVPEYIPVSHIRLVLKNAHIVVVWRDYNLGVIENTKHSLNVVTDTRMIDNVNNSVYVPERVHDIFSVLRAVSSDVEKTRVIEDDSELEHKTVFERAHMFKDTKTYKGKKFVREAYVAGCDVLTDDIPIIATRESVARHLNDYLNKLLIFLSINGNDS